MVLHLPQASKCPICGARPDIDRCVPWPRDAGPQPFYAVCYQGGEDEHCVGANGDNMRDVIEQWNAEVATHTSR